MKDELRALERAADRCAKAQGRISRRNARRVFLGALLSLRNALERDYPGIPKPPPTPPVYDSWPSPTGPARQVWEFLFGEPWPARGRVEWAGFMRGATGLCCGFGKRFRIVLSYGDARREKRPEHGPIGVLAHEFLHARGYHRHNNEFRAAERRLLARLGLAA